MGVNGSKRFMMWILLLSWAFLLLGAKDIYGQEIKTIRPGDCAEGVLGREHPIDEYTFTAETYTLNYRVELSSSVIKNPDITVGIYDEAGNLLGERSEWDWQDDDSILYFRKYPSLKLYAEAPRCKPGKYYIRVTASDTALEGTDYQIRLTKDNTYGTVSLSKTEDTYDGKKKKLPGVTVYDCDGKKLKQSEYTCWWSFERNDNKPYTASKYVTEPGEYSLRLKYHEERGYFESMDRDRYNIMIQDSGEEYDNEVLCVYHLKLAEPKRCQITKAKSGTGKITASCKKIKVKEAGYLKYVWQLSDTPDFDNPITKHRKVNNVSFDNYYGSALQKGKTYYLRVMVFNATTYDVAYGKYSKIKQVKYI